MRLVPALPWLAAVLVAAALVAPAAGARSASSASDAGEIAALLKRQTALWNAARWQALWRTYTPRFRRSCEYRLWLSEQRAAKRLFGGKIAVRSIRVRVRGRKASVSYILLLGEVGRSVVQPPRADLYVKVGRRWFDEGDQITKCRAGAI
jgi:hypothetical protein